MTTATVAERVERGAAWLDIVRPGWEDVMVLPEFDIRSTCSCVLGQVFDEDAEKDHDSGYNVGLSYAVGAVGTAPADIDAWAVGMGFDAAASESASQPNDYAALQAEWAFVIAERQDARVRPLVSA